MLQGSGRGLRTRKPVEVSGQSGVVGFLLPPWGFLGRWAWQQELLATFSATPLPFLVCKVITATLPNCTESLSKRSIMRLPGAMQLPILTPNELKVLRMDAFSGVQFNKRLVELVSLNHTRDTDHYYFLLKKNIFGNYNHNISLY